MSEQLVLYTTSVVLVVRLIGPLRAHSGCLRTVKVPHAFAMVLSTVGMQVCLHDTIRLLQATASQ